MNKGDTVADPFNRMLRITASNRLLGFDELKSAGYGKEYKMILFNCCTPYIVPDENRNANSYLTFDCQYLDNYPEFDINKNERHRQQFSVKSFDKAWTKCINIHAHQKVQERILELLRKKENFHVAIKCKRLTQGKFEINKIKIVEDT